MRKRSWVPGLSYANVVATLALFVALGGSAYAVKQLPKNSVGPKQLRKNAVRTGDISRNAVRVGKLDKEAVKAGKLAKNAVPTNRLRNDAVTGAKVNESTLSTVPSAQTANSIVPPEGWHEVGTPGEPGFLNAWTNAAAPSETAAFFKDREGMVHLKGTVTGGTALDVFVLPPGYRPAIGKAPLFAVFCLKCPSGVGPAQVYGPGTGPFGDGAVALPDPEASSLDGITFRAES